MHELLAEKGSDVKIFGGGGGTILPSEIDDLHAHGIDRIYSPDDGRQMGLQGMINDLLESADRPRRAASAWPEHLARLEQGDDTDLAALITIAENHPEVHEALLGRGGGTTRRASGCPSWASRAPAARASRASSTS